MKSDSLLRHVVVPFGIAVLVYVIFYTWIEHRRTRNGPWEVKFTNDASEAPAILINQPKLAITNVLIAFPDETNRLKSQASSWSFSQPREVPFAVGFGKCLFMDTTFLPGTVVLDIAGHEIQLIPRVLTIDKREIPWRCNTAIELPPTNSSYSTNGPALQNAH